MEYAFSQFTASFGSSRGELFPTFKKLATNVHDHVIPHARNNYHPHILGHRFLGLFSMLLITVKIAALALPILTLSAVPTADASAITTDTIFSLTNDSRIEYNLQPLTKNAKLAKAAQAKADDMLAKQYFAHNSPDGVTPWTFIKNAGYSYLSAGENLAVDFTQAENVETAWMNSPGHRANILNKNFQEIGIGISRGMFEGHQTVFVVQEFGTPIKAVAKTEAPAPAPATTQVAAVPAPATPGTTAPQQAATTPSKVVPPIQSNTPAPASPVASAKPVPVNSAPVLSASAQSVTPATLPTGDQPVVVVASTPVAGLAFENPNLTPTDGGLKLTTTTTPDAVKVIATYGLQSYMLDPVANGQWQAVIPFNAATSGPVTIAAYDISGKSIQQRLASVAPNLQSNYANGVVKGASVSFFGREIDTKAFEQQFYLISITALLSFMIIAIGVRYKVQHVSMIANSSFVVMLACLLWMAH